MSRYCRFDNDNICCPTCGRTAKARHTKAMCKAHPFFHDRPGTELKRILDQLELHPKNGCNCESIQEKMDQLGTEGCKQERALLLEALRENAKNYSLLEKLTAARNAAKLGIATELLSLDPIAALFDYAISKTEASLSERSAPGVSPQ